MNFIVYEDSRVDITLNILITTLNEIFIYNKSLTKWSYKKNYEEFDEYIYN